MLKMRVAENEKPKRTDPRIEFTEKVFYLVESFGGEAADYEGFVSGNVGRSKEELFEMYFKENGHLLERILGDKLVMMTRKLGFYF
jgi:hypothetical protein